MERYAKKVCGKKRKKDLTESTLLEMSEYATSQAQSAARLLESDGFANLGGGVGCAIASQQMRTRPSMKAIKP
jgi:hypothetical protein